MAYIPLLASLNGGVLAKFADRHIAEAWLPRVVTGEAVVAVGLTEPSGGSDAAALSMHAERRPDGYCLRGEKTSVSMTTQAHAAIVFARTGTREDGARGVSGFFVPLDARGIARTTIDDLGSRAVGRGSIFFDDVILPHDHLLGEEGRGFGQIMQGFDYSRALIGLQCIGAAQASLDETWAYIEQRQAFGRPLADFQGVTFPLAECDAWLEAARQLCYQTLRLRDQGLPHTREAAMSKWLGPKTAFETIHQCLLSHGHYGYSTDLPHQQRLRDVMGLEIGDGTAQVMKMIISRTRATGASRR
jgi:cyclohexanecarboxyl-CoA dehydrogenase